MKKATKQEVVDLIGGLKQKGWTTEELAVAIGKTVTTIYYWGNILNSRKPGKSDYEVLKRLLAK